MTKRFWISIALVTLLASAFGAAAAQSAADVPGDPTAVGYLNLHKRHPDGLEGPAEFNRYSVEEALGRLKQIEGFLSSFARMTARVRTRLGPEQLRGVGNTDAEMQMLGFHNIPLEVEGLMLKQDYQLRQAQYELAQLKYAQRSTDAESVARAKAAYQKATARLQVFWDTRLPAD